MAALAAIAGALGLYLKGRSDAKHKAENKEMHRRVEAQAERMEVEDAIDRKSDNDARDALARWMRDNPR